MVIIQLLKDTKYPANYQIIIDSSLGNFAVQRDFFSALGTGRGMGPARYEISRSDDEGDCGRGRSEAKPNGVPPMAVPCERNTKKKVTLSVSRLFSLF